MKIMKMAVTGILGISAVGFLVSAWTLVMVLMGAK